MLSPSRAYRHRGLRAKAIKRVRNVESFAESKVAECEATGCTKHKRTHTTEEDKCSGCCLLFGFTLQCEIARADCT